MRKNYYEVLGKQAFLTFFALSLVLSTSTAYADDVVGKNTSVTTVAQQKSVTGLVKDDATGEAVIGATIHVKGTVNAVASDVNGQFVINGVNPNDVLVVEFVGYATQEIQIGTQSNLTISLKNDVQHIDEVVVVGYGTQQRNAVTSSMAVVKADKLKDQAVTNVGSMLQGKVAGVSVSNSSGKPDASTKIVIRGKGTINSSSEPLWVVDGVVYNVDPRLSPSEVESLSVLKDASATAIYGSRGSNGVIVITTNKGKAGKAFQASVNVGVKTLDLGNLKLMNSQQLYDYQKSFNALSWFNEDLLKNDTDWFKQATQNGVYTNANFSFNGGSEVVQSYLLMDYYRETAAVKDMAFERFTIRANNDYKWAKNFTAFTRIQTQYETQKDQSASLYDTYLYLPWDYAYNNDGSLRDGTEKDWLSRDKRNYMADQYKDWSKKMRAYINVTAGFKWDFTNYLSFESNNNVNMFLERAESYTDPKSRGGQANNGQVYNYYQFRQNFFTNQMLRFKKTYGKHSINALAAYEYTRLFDQVSTATAKGITAGKEVIDGTTGMVGMTGYKSAYNIQSFLANANYAYDGRYMFQASYRLDGSSKFGTDTQYGSFYTLSGGWNIDAEKFWAPMHDVVDGFKLRASWGVVGNTPDGNYNHLSLYTAGQYNENPANFPSQLGNKNLTWEKNQTTNVGIDLSFLGRFRLSVDWYDKNTNGLLYYAALSTITGYTGQWQNIGAIRNTGFEIVANADIIANKDWNWNVNANISFNKNRVVSLYEGRPMIAGIRRYEEGRDMDDLYLAEWAGVDPKNGDPLWYTNDKDGNRVTTNNYSKATGDNSAYVGSAAPKFLGGFGTVLSWKGITLNANFAYSVGGKLYSQNREVMDSDGAYLDYNAMVLAPGWNRWEKEGDIATHPKAISGGNLKSNNVSSRYVEDASYLTLRNLSLSYELGEKAVKSLGIRGLRIGISADNLFTSTKYSQISPDAAGSSGDGYAGWTAYPTTRSYILNVNVRF